MTVSFATIPVPGFTIQDVSNTFLNAIGQSAASVQASVNSVTPGDPQSVLNVQLQMSQYTLTISTVSQAINSLTTISRQVTQAIGQA